MNIPKVIIYIFNSFKNKDANLEDFFNRDKDENDFNVYKKMSYIARKTKTMPQFSRIWNKQINILKNIHKKIKIIYQIMLHLLFIQMIPLLTKDIELSIKVKNCMVLDIGDLMLIIFYIVQNMIKIKKWKNKIRIKTRMKK